MAKIIHASNFQLGRRFSGIGRSADQLRAALKESLELSIRHALDQSVDLFLVTGNLFASNLVSRHLIEFVYGQIERLGRIPFAVVPGNCDCLEENSVYHYLPAEDRPDNLFVVGDSIAPYLNFPDSEVTIYGVHGRDSDVNGAEFPTLIKQNFSGVHIVAIADVSAVESDSAGVASTDIIALLEQSEFDYVAYGGSESFRALGRKSYCSGSPEVTEFDGTDTGQVLLVDLQNGNLKVEDIPTGQLRWQRLDLASKNYRYNIEIEEELLQKADPQTLLGVRIVGDCINDGFLDLTALEQEMKGKFLFLEIEDARTFSLGAMKGASNSASSLYNDFALLLEEAVAKSPAELRAQYLQAMYTGCAMLSGKDVI